MKDNLTGDLFSVSSNAWFYSQVNWNS
jgi:hypothetical protein